MHLRRVIICAVQAAAKGLGVARNEKGSRGMAKEGVEETGEEDGKGNNSEVDHAFCLEARLRTSKIVLRPIFLPLRATPLSFSPLAFSFLPFSVAFSLPQRRVDACVRTQARKVLLSPTLTHVQRRISNLVFLFLLLFSLASLLLSNLTPRKRAHNRVSALFNVGGLLLTNTRLISSSSSFHQPLFLLSPPPSPLPLPPLSFS